MRRRRRADFAALGLALALGGLTSTVVAEEQKAGEKPAAEKEKGAKGATVDPATGKRLNEAIEHLNAKRYAEAKATLGKINADRLSPYELARVEQLLAVVDQAQGSYGAARDHLAKAIASGGLNDQEVSTARFQIAQLYMSENRWKEGVEALKQWFATAQNPNSSAYHLLAVAYYQLGDHASAVEPAQKAVDLAGQKPQESWVQLLLALRLERQEFKLAIPLLKYLIEASPTKKGYWLQLAGVHSSLGSYADAVLPLQAAYTAGLLTEDADLQRLTQMLMQVTIPYRAAQILGQAIEQGKVKSDVRSNELLANCWVASREYEKALAPLRRAAELSEAGDLYVRLAEVHVQREEWAKASEALRLGVDKGRLKNPGNAKLLMGVAVYNQKKLPEAHSWFERAREHAESRSQAEAWLAHIDSQAPSASAEAPTKSRPGA